MALSSLSSPKHYTLPVYRGSTATLLRAASQPTPANFTSQDIVYTVELDKPTYRLVIKAPLIHTKILLAVGEKMSSTVAKGLAQEIAQTGRVTKDSIVLKIAENQVKFWVQEVIQKEGPALRAWKKARLANGVQVLKCVFSLATAGIGLASSAATFGATSIPAVIAAWTAVADTAGFLARAWQAVRAAERAMLNQVAKIYDAYARYKNGQKTVVPGPGRSAGSIPTGHSRMGAHLRSAGDSVASALHLNTITSVQGMSLGPSVSGLQSAIANYETKLAHLVHEANKLTSILTDLLDTTLQLAITNGPDDPVVKANQDRIDRMIGNEAGSKGVSRRRDMFRRPISIIWLQTYFDAGRVIAGNMRRQLLDLLQTTPLNQLDAQQKTADLLFMIGKWLGGNHAALTSGSITAFADAVFKDDNGISVNSINEVWGEISKWGAQAKSAVDSMRRKYPNDTSSDLVKECKVEYLAAAEEVGGGALGVYDKVRAAYAEWLPDISSYTNPYSVADKALSGQLLPGSGS